MVTTDTFFQKVGKMAEKIPLKAQKRIIDSLTLMRLVVDIDYDVSDTDAETRKLMQQAINLLTKYFQSEKML